MRTLVLITVVRLLGSTISAVIDWPRSLRKVETHDFENEREDAVRTLSAGGNVSSLHCRDNVAMTPDIDFSGRLCDTVIRIGIDSPGKHAGLKSSIVAMGWGCAETVGEGGNEGVLLEGFLGREGERGGDGFGG